LKAIGAFDQYHPKIDGITSEISKFQKLVLEDKADIGV